MKKLKKQLITKYLQRVASPSRLSLKETVSLYSKLIKKYGDSKTIKIVDRSGYYSDGFWLVERRLETDSELAKRQSAYDKRMAAQKAETLRWAAVRKADAIKRRAADKKAKLEKEVEKVKNMVEALKLVGFEVVPKNRVSARN